MLKVSGVTFCNTTNYGTSLQAYALQKAVENIQIDGEACQYELIRLWDCKDYPRKKRFSLQMALSIISGFHRFEEKEIHFYRPKTLSELKHLNESRDAFVCGSDVIWNPKFNHELSAYYLDFAQKYKFSYAASFGQSNIPEEKLQKIGEYIKEFDQIGVREKSGETIARRFSDAPVQIVVDPVLLLDRREWNTVAGPSVSKEKYIFVYSTHETAAFNAFVDKIVQETGLKVKNAAWGRSIRKSLKKGVFRILTQPEWIRMIRDAEYVVTNSFHATAFSVIFKKKFFTVVGGKKDQGTNVRMFDFLSGIGLEDRILDEVPADVDTRAPDYEEVEPCLNAIIESSKTFLQNNLRAAFEQK